MFPRKNSRSANGAEPDSFGLCRGEKTQNETQPYNPNFMNEPKLSQRLLSLDALRGFDMLFIMGFATLVVNVCHLFPGDVSAAVAESMSHPAWHGFSHHDTIFPLFLFIAGISYPFSLAKQRSLGATQGDLYRKILKRGALLILFGLIYNGLFRLDWPMRTASVLGRIGLAWALAAMLFLNFRTRTRIGIVGAILCGHDGRRAGLYHVCVQENYRKHGIGQKLVERCLEALKAEKISKVNLIAFKQNEIGNRFWQSLGWKYCDNVNYYEYVLNEENITVFNP